MGKTKKKRSIKKKKHKKEKNSCFGCRNFLKDMEEEAGKKKGEMSGLYKNINRVIQPDDYPNSTLYFKLVIML